MEPQAQPSPSPDRQMTELRERMIRLEMAAHYEREALYREMGGLAMQLHQLRQQLSEASVMAPMTGGGWAKLGLALLLPLGVLLATGSADKAVHTARALSGVP